MKNGIHSLGDMIGTKNLRSRAEGYNYVRSVPSPFHGGFLIRIKAALSVIQGKAYAVSWPNPGELEKAMEK